MAKVSELSGALLALWVARADGICLHDAPHTKPCGNWGTDYTCTRCGKDAYEGPTVRSWRPHEDWAQGGPLIERHRIMVAPCFDETGWTCEMWSDRIESMGYFTTGGETALSAAMRALVQSKYGDDVPDEVAPATT